MAITFYCVKCRAKKDVDDARVERTSLKNGRPAAKAVCPDCGTGMFKILSVKEA
ncbi:MAG: hypothetical protein BWZ03_00610 [bacterium ADurb.BinA186]|nr:MAG: hypothetical protein BWZ03_00610 [bacterium ADurb.BinA186]